MKNNTMNTHKAINDLSNRLTCNPADIAAQFQAKRNAQKAYEKARYEFAKNVADYLKNAPEGTMILNSDLAKKCGIGNAHMAVLMYQDAHPLGIRADSVTTTKHYVEVDENGNVLDNGDQLTVRKSRTAWRKMNSRGW